MSTRGRIGRTGALAVAGVLAIAPFCALADSVLPPPTQTAIAQAIADATDAGQCPAADALTSLAAAQPEATPAIAQFTAQRLRARDDVAGRHEADDAGRTDSRCGCAADLTVELAAAAPDHAAKVREAFAGAFPECDSKITHAVEQSLAGAAAGPGIPLSYRPNIPTYGPYGDPSAKCTAACSAVEPPPTHDASRTAL